ncbi:MAG: tRNA (adenosine(37)-N6)-threonylcarbamoyltransferase complex ATPase subunit type 1 TsaE [Neisseria sp.]|nr:tRNA (adenosine(37)-N6)-threonylcarbamoyltransferase complex ATPase subunit type 1 TsaE [Neisseria sp.]
MLPETMTVFLPDETATAALATRCSGSLYAAAAHATQAVTVYLHGDLGSGKTTFVRGFLRAMGFTGNVKSPTYNLLETYHLPAARVLHFDLYRFHEPQEWEEAGFDDEMHAPVLALIEWAQCAEGFVPPADISFAFAVQNEGRMCTITPHTATGQEMFTAWQNSPDDKF